MTSAVAAGGDVPSLLTAIRQREARRKHLAEEIAGRLVMTPDPDVTTGYSIVTGDADLTKFFSGIDLAKGLTSPTGTVKGGIIRFWAEARLA